MLPQAICFQFGIHLLTRNATGWNNAGRERLAATLSALYVPAEATAAPIRHPGPGWKDRGSATCGTALPTLRARLANARLLCQARGDTPTYGAYCAFRTSASMQRTTTARLANLTMQSRRTTLVPPSPPIVRLPKVLPHKKCARSACSSPQQLIVP